MSARFPVGDCPVRKKLWDSCRWLYAVVAYGSGKHGFHSLSPQAVFANIAPPSLEPAYALQCSAFSWYKEFTTQLPNADCFHRRLLNSVLAPSCLVAAIQRRLVCVWQTYIGRWHEGASLTRYRLTFKQPPPAWYRAPPRQMNCNGHVLRACPRSEGVFCVKAVALRNNGSSAGRLHAFLVAFDIRPRVNGFPSLTFTTMRTASVRTLPLLLP